MRTGTLPLTDEMVEEVARRFRLLGEPARLRLLQLLEAGERTVNELTEEIQGNQANVSRHLMAMFDGGILIRRRHGSSVYYSIADPVVFKLCELVCNSTREQVRVKLGALSRTVARKKSGVSET